jgi:hypothetical protein
MKSFKAKFVDCIVHKLQTLRTQRAILLLLQFKKLLTILNYMVIPDILFQTKTSLDMDFNSLTGQLKKDIS